MMVPLRTAALVSLAASAAAFAPAALPSLRADTRAAHGLAGLSMAERQPFMAGNWKMNPETLDEALKLAEATAAGKTRTDVQAAIFVPFPYLSAIREKLEGSGVELGAQSCYFEKKGAFTGATSTSQLKSVGAKHVIVGHSERRTIWQHDDQRINTQVLAVLAQGLLPILCVGETKQEYEGKLNKQVCAIQLSKALKGVSKADMAKITIAYEPVWAIGTGLVCDTETAQDVHAFIRSWLAKLYDQDTADKVRIQYGGSVTPDSVDALMAMPDIDGCLVGGASLDAAKFARIMNFK